jgi:hypothetical protein
LFGGSCSNVEGRLIAEFVAEVNNYFLLFLGRPLTTDYTDDTDVRK